MRDRSSVPRMKAKNTAFHTHVPTYTCIPIRAGKVALLQYLCTSYGFRHVHVFEHFMGLKMWYLTELS